MTTVPPSIAVETPEAPSAPRESAWALRLRAVEQKLIDLTEGANPILVKETRQALKSRQFVVTFLIVLIACWIVSFVGVAIVGPEIYYAASGPDFLIWYYGILVFPLSLIVPFTAFRSLAAEQEEQTYDLLSITSLGSRQIVTGKLLSATVQMIVYLSAVSPCIAFTFLLRGVDALTTAVLLAIAVLGCLGLSMIALLVGAVARAKQTQVVTSVALVLGLAGAFSSGLAAGVGILEEAAMLRDPLFWVLAFGFLTIYATTFGLLHSAAAAQIAFSSENRSTPLRRWMMAQQACFCGWVGALTYVFGNPTSTLRGGPITDLIIVAGVLSSLYWFAMGAMLTGEWPHLSRRVQRSLPKSSLGRTFLSLLNPGPGAGYLFAVANLTMLVAAGLALVVVFGPRGGWTSTETVMYFLILAWSYVVAFLGYGRLLINMIRRWAYVPMAAAFLLHVILLLAAIGIPTVIQLTSQEFRGSGYTILQLTNPVWTLEELCDRGVNAVQGEVLIFIVPALALAALLLNMRSVATELLHQRIEPPIRVAEEEAALHPAPAPKPSSPWEVEDEAETD